MNDHDNAPEKLPADDPQPGSGDDVSRPEISGVDFEFTEPELGAAEISPEVADSVDLDQVEAEAAKVEREAERSAQLPASEVISAIPAARIDFDARADSPVRDDDGATVPRADVTKAAASTDSLTPPAADEAAPDAPAADEAAPDAPAADEAAPDAPAAAEQDNRDQDNTEQPASGAESLPGAASLPGGTSGGAAPHIGHGIDDGSGWRRPETPWQQSATPWQPKANSWQSPGQVARGEADATALAASQAGQAPMGEPAQSDGGAATPGTSPAGPAPHGESQTPGQPGIPPAPAVQVPAARVQPGAAGATPGAQWQSGPGVPQGPGSPQGPGALGTSGTPQNNNNKIFIILGLVIVGLGLLAVLVWIVAGLVSGGKTNASSDAQSVASSSHVAQASNQAGVIQAQVSPLEWFEGDCLRNFTDVSKPADVVLCSSPHSAQLVGTFYYQDGATFPGTDALSAKGDAVCSAVKLTGTSKDLKQTVAYPTEATWTGSNDRRVDCIISDPSGNNLKSSLIQ